METEVELCGKRFGIGPGRSSALRVLRETQLEALNGEAGTKFSAVQRVASRNGQGSRDLARHTGYSGPYLTIPL